jgi:hypothetical protein
LNIRKATLREPGQRGSTFYITDADTSEKILKSARLEEIRMTIINNMLYYHPVSDQHHCHALHCICTYRPWLLTIQLCCAQGCNP